MWFKGSFMNRRIVFAFLIFIMMALPFAVLARDVYVSFDWSGVDVVPQYLRYQIDGVDDGGWVPCDPDAEGLLLSLDGAAHMVYVQASYDGVIYGKASVAEIAPEAGSAVALGDAAASGRGAAAEAVASAGSEADSGADSDAYSSDADVASVAGASQEAGGKAAVRSMASLNGSFCLYKTGTDVSKCLALDFTHDFFFNQSSLGLGYSIGVLWDRPLVFGLKVGADAAYLSGRSALSLGGGVMADMDVQARDAVTLSAYWDVGLRFAVTERFAIGAKFTYVYSLKDFPL